MRKHIRFQVLVSAALNELRRLREEADPVKMAEFNVPSMEPMQTLVGFACKVTVGALTDIQVTNIIIRGQSHVGEIDFLNMDMKNVYYQLAKDLHDTSKKMTLLDAMRLMLAHELWYKVIELDV